MKLRNLILRISGVVLITIILAITLLAITYKISKKYKYVYYNENKFSKSSNCFIDKNDFRVCESKKGLIRVEMFYKEEDNG